MNPSIAFLLGLVVKSTMLLLAACLACRLLRRSSAALRHWVCVSAVVALLLLPLLSLSLPRWNVRVPAENSRLSEPPPTSFLGHLPLPGEGKPPPSLPIQKGGGAGEKAALSSSLPWQGRDRRLAARDRSAPVASAAAPASRHAFPWLAALRATALLLWLIGALVVLVHLAVGLRRVGQIARRAVALDADAKRIAEAAHAQLGLRRPVRFLQASEPHTVSIPLTWGVLRPVVVLPAASRAWSKECLRAALLHELAHVQRQDWLTQTVARLACALYWWHPLAWLVARRARAEAERACDDLALSTGLPAADYAQRLVQIVRSLPAAARPFPAAVGMAQPPSEVAQRVADILAPGRNRRRLSAKWSVLTLAATALFLCPLAALRTDAQVSVSQAPLPAPSAQPTNYEATLPNGYTVKLVGVTRGVGDKQHGLTFTGPFWTPNGTLTPNLLPKPEDAHGPYLTKQWSPAPQKEVALDLTLTHLPPTQPASVSTCYQLIGGTGWFEDSEIKFTASGTGRVSGTASPIYAGQRYAFDIRSPHTLVLHIFVHGADRACTLRCGVAAGAWHTVKAFPAENWRDKNDNLFPGESLYATLTDVGEEAVQAVAVNNSGQQQQLQVSSHSPLISMVAYTGGVSSRHVSYLPYVPSTFGRVKTVLIQTRPYQFAEFRNVHLQPRPAASQDLRGKVIVVDPGHGAQDSGAVAPSNVMEKSLNLAIAQRLQVTLEQRGATVFLTRDDDTFLTIQQRVQLAAQKQAAYLISLHCDEESPQHYGPPGAVIYYHDHAPENELFARSVQTSVRHTTGLSSRGVSDFTRFPHGGFGVLRGSSMPAVLVECGDMSIPADLARLIDPTEQQKIADGIAAGVSAFHSTQERAQTPPSVKPKQTVSRGWLTLPATATTQPLMFQNRVNGKLLCVVHAAGGYDPATRTLRQVTITQYRNGRVADTMQCDKVQFQSGQHLTTSVPIHVTRVAVSVGKEQMLTMQGQQATFDLSHHAVTISGK